MKTTLLRSIFMVCFGIGTYLNAQTIDVTFTNLESSKGQIVMGLYQDQATWEKEKPALTKFFPKGANVSGSTLKVTLNLTPGTWALSMLDDTNEDYKMNYNWLGLPKEGFGFSNIYHTGWSKPKFKDFSVTLAAGQRISVTIKVRYL